MRSLSMTLVRHGRNAVAGISGGAVRGVIRVFAAVIMAVLMVAALFVSPNAALAASGSDGVPTKASFDYTTWTQISDKIAEQLNEGSTDYKNGDHSGASSAFNSAYSITYVSTNFSQATIDKLGQEKFQSQQQQFNTIKSLAYQQGKEGDIDSGIATLTADIADTATQLDNASDLLKPQEYYTARAEKTNAQRKTLEANKVNKNTGKGDRTWTDVANEMTPILDKALKAAKAGDGRKGSDLVNNAYYQYYEKLGFEKNVMNAIGGDRVSKVESTFKEARKAMVAGEDATQHITSLKSMLVEDAGKLDGGAADNVNGFTKFITSSVGQAFLILIREGLEALLVVAAIIAYLIKSENKRFVKWIYVGVLAGLAGSGVVAVLFGLLFGGSGPIQEIMEGVCALIAMGMLLWTSNWMLNKSSVEAWNKYIKNKTESAVASADAVASAGEKTTVGTMVSLAMLSFLAVFREGAETVIFYESIYSMSRDSRGMWIGGIAAAVVLVIVFLIIRFTSVKIPIGPFFLVTSILMSILVVVFAGGGVHALIEGDALGGMYLNGVPTNDWLGFYPYVETIVAQAIAAVAVIALFVVGFIKQRKAKAKLASAEPAK
ncbi:iron permease [Bifidobacterium callimiconis]|uniref:Iron permease n=2 Tax=Bifidobacterium callimiconis TaxID=2306973 RepID=A0A430FB34_9BIFI|nr:iron permease [Bifidobacterium callimiconis]